MTTEIKTVGIYARVSTNKQENDNQLDQLRTFAAKQGWQIVADETSDICLAYVRA